MWEHSLAFASISNLVNTECTRSEVSRNMEPGCVPSWCQSTHRKLSCVIQLSSWDCAPRYHQGFQLQHNCMQRLCGNLPVKPA